MYLKPYISEDLWILSFSTKTQFNEKYIFFWWNMTYLHLPICISGINISLFDEEFKMWPNIYDIGFEG